MIPGRNSTAHSLSNQQAHRGRNDDRNLASIATTRPAAAISAIRTTRIQRANVSSSFSDVPNRTQPSPPSTNDFFSSNVLPAKRQPLQQHSFNAPAPATTSTAAAAALPPEPFRNPASITISPHQREHQRQSEKQQQRTCITIDQLLQAASSTSNTTHRQRI